MNSETPLDGNFPYKASIKRLKFLQIGNIYVDRDKAEFPVSDAVFLSIAAKLARLSNVPKPLRLYRIRETGDVQVEVPDVKVNGHITRVDFTHAENVLLPDISVFCYLNYLAPDSKEINYCYACTRIPLLLRSIEKLRIGETVPFHEYSYVLVSEAGDPGALRVFFQLSYNFGEDATHVTLVSKD